MKLKQVERDFVASVELIFFKMNGRNITVMVQARYIVGLTLISLKFIFTECRGGYGSSPDSKKARWPMPGNVHKVIVRGM